MDFLTQTLRRQLDQWRASPARARWILGILLAIGCAALGLAIAWPRPEPRELLFDGVEFSRGEMTAMEAAFGKAQLNEARVVDGRFEVPRRAKHLYLKALMDQQALPATFFTFAQRSLAADHPFTSPRQREAAAKLAKEQEIALMLRKISGIEEASVQYEDTDLGGFPRRRQRQATAAVRARGDRTLDGTVVHAIRATLMNTLGIASADSVTILDLNAGVAHTGEAPHFAPAASEPPSPGAAPATPRVARSTAALPISHGAATGDKTPAIAARALPPARPTSPSQAAEAPHTQEESHAPARQTVETPLPRENEGLALASSPSSMKNSDDSLPWSDAIPGLEKMKIRWLTDNALTLAGAAFGLFCLGQLWRVLRQTRHEGRQARSLLRDMKHPAAPVSEPTTVEPSIPPTRSVPRPPLPRQQLHEQIQGNPGGAAATLRQWLGNAV